MDDEGDDLGYFGLDIGSDFKAWLSDDGTVSEPEYNPPPSSDEDLAPNLTLSP